MNKHKELLKHRSISRTCITDNGGWIIVFDDESHTYLSPDDVTDLVLKTYKILTEKSE